MACVYEVSHFLAADRARHLPDKNLKVFIFFKNIFPLYLLLLKTYKQLGNVKKRKKQFKKMKA